MSDIDYNVSAGVNYEAALTLPCLDEDGDLAQFILASSIMAAGRYWEADSEDPPWTYQQAAQSEAIFHASVAGLAQLWLYEYTVGYGELADTVYGDSTSGRYVLNEGVG